MPGSGTDDTGTVASSDVTEPTADTETATDTETVTDTETATGTETATEPGTATDTETATDTGTTDPFTPVVDEEDVEPGDLSERLFDQTFVHTVDIELSPEGITALTADPYTYVPGAVTVDGIEVDEIGVRLRGKIGSFRPITGKPKWKLDLNQYVEGQMLYGVETLSLNNSVGDCSYLKEVLTYDVFREVGLPASRIAFAEVRLNGEPYGLYQLVETQDDRFLDYNYDDPSGNFYDGKYLYDEVTGESLTLDFEPELYPLFQLEEGVDVGHEDLRLLTEVITLTMGTPAYYAETGAVLDWDHNHRYLVAEQWADNWDGYTLNQNNYRVYFHAETGLAQLVPFDVDLGLDDFWLWDLFFSWSTPEGVIADACWDDPDCATAHAAVVARTLEIIDAGGFEDRIDAWDLLTKDAATADPRRECSIGSVESGREDLRRIASARSAELRDFWGL